MPAFCNSATIYNLVHSIKISNDGLVYVADRSNQRIQVFTAAGKFVKQTMICSRGQTAAGLAFSPDALQQFLYVANLGDWQIVILNRKTMETVGTFESAGSGPGQFQTLHHFAADSKGNIYTTEIGRGRRAQKLAKEGDWPRKGRQIHKRAGASDTVVLYCAASFRKRPDVLEYTHMHLMQNGV